MTDKNLRVIDISTGEIADSTKYKVATVATEAQREWTMQRAELKQYHEEQDGFVFTLYRLEEYLGKELTQADLARLLFMATHLNYENKLAYKNKVAITKKKLAGLLKLKERAFRTFYSTVTELGILIEEDNGNSLFMNKLYFSKGKIDSDELTVQGIPYTRTYVKGIQDLYEEYGGTKQVKQLGVLYLVIPYLHYDSNILVKHADETNPAKIGELTLNEVANVIGYNAKNISRTLKDIILGDEYVFLIIDGGKYKSVVVNPRIFWRAKTSPKGTIDTLFQARKAHRLGGIK